MLLDVGLLDKQILTLLGLKNGTDSDDHIEGVVSLLEEISSRAGDNFGEEISMTFQIENAEAKHAEMEKFKQIFYQEYRTNKSVKFLGYNLRFLNAAFIVTSRFSTARSKFNTLEDAITYMATKIVYSD